MAHQQDKRGSNLSQDARRKEGEHAHHNNQGGRGSNLSKEDRRKGGEESHK